MNKLSLLQPSVAMAFYGRFNSLYEIQQKAIKPILEGRNVVLSAPTGKGKTEAVIAPLVSRYYEEIFCNNSLTILYVSPTKALVNDLERRLSAPLLEIGIRLGIRHGDRDDTRRSGKPQVLITTPESLDVMLFRDNGALKTIRAIVIDEVHLFYNTQRGLHLSILINRLKGILYSKLQWVALSATIGNVKNVSNFLFGSSEDVVFLKDEGKRRIDAQIRFLSNMSELVKLFEKLYTKRHHLKFLVFVNSRKECETIARSLTESEIPSESILAHYSSLSVRLREHTEKKFNDSSKAICISTSTLELGIDIGDVDAVFLFGPPSGVDSFLQRIGRGNRRINETKVVCLVKPDSVNPNLEAIIFHSLIELARESRLPNRQPYELFGAIAQQALSYVGSRNGAYVRVAELAEICKHLPHLSRENIEPVLEKLAMDGYLKAHDFKRSYGAGQKLHRLISYRMIFGNFPITLEDIEVNDGKQTLGVVPRYNLLNIQLGDYVSFNGKTWRVSHLNRDFIRLERSNARKNVKDFIYYGSSINIDCYVLKKAWEILHDTSFETELYDKKILPSIISYVEEFTNSTKILDVPYWETPKGYHYLTFAGKLINTAIAYITKQPDFLADDISLLCTNKVDWSSIPTKPAEYSSVFHHLLSSNSEQTFFQTILPKDYQIRELIQTWLKDKAIEEHLNRLQKSEDRLMQPEQMKTFFLNLLEVNEKIFND